jgi:type IV secretory pathway VirB6-like protein
MSLEAVGSSQTQDPSSSTTHLQNVISSNKQYYFISYREQFQFYPVQQVSHPLATHTQANATSTINWEDN